MQKLRIVDGRTLREVAAAYGCSASHLSRVERGGAKPSRALVLFYDDAFGGEGMLASLFEAVSHSLEQKRQRARRSGLRLSHARPGDASVFVDDFPPNGTAFAPGEFFAKTWQVQNAGSVAWRGRQIERQGPITGPGLLTSPRCVAVPDTSPGEVATIGVILKAPGYACTSIAYFKMIDDDGALCFPDDYALGLEVIVRVDSQALGTSRSGSHGQRRE